MNWTVKYYAKNGDIYIRKDIVFYELQEAISDCSREAYENGTEANFIMVI